MRELVQSELEEAEIEDSGYDLKYRRDDEASRDSEGDVYILEDFSNWYEGSEFTSIEMDQSVGIEEISLNLMTGDTQIRDNDGNRLYNFCGTYEGETAMLSTLGETEFALLYDEVNNSLTGINRETGDKEDLGTETNDKTSLMREIEFVRDFYSNVFSQVWSTDQQKDYEIEIHPQMERDLEKFEDNKKGTLTRKISQADENINEHGVEPEKAFNKTLQTPLHDMIQMPLGSGDRAWFIKGEKVDGAEDDKVYGLRAFNHDEAENVNAKLTSADITATEYAERFI